MSQYLNKINPSDLSLINNKELLDVFGLVNDVAEIHIYDSNNTLVTSDYNYTSYKPDANYGLLNSNLQSLEIDPILDCTNRGFVEGKYSIHYNFLRKLSNEYLFIKEISSNRQEISLSSNTLSNIEIESLYNTLKDNFEKYNYLKYDLLNFQSNKLFLIVNVALNTTDDVYEIYVKLYEPLDASITIKSFCWVQQEVIPTNVVDIELVLPTQTIEPVKKLQPNFDINLDDKKSFSTDYLDTDTLEQNFGGFNNLFFSKPNNKSLPINVNWEDFSEFVHFSNVVSRIKNFMYKVNLIETYLYNIDNNIGNIITYQSRLSDVLTKFDQYEYFLYTSTSPKAYPKDNDGLLLPSSSQTVINWLGNADYEGSNNSGILGEAKIYDDFNLSSLVNSIPNYILIDERNTPLFHFLNLVGHHFDNIWIYIRKMTDIYVANNNMNKGISPDLVETVLKSFGVKLYNSLSNVDVTQLPQKNYSKEIYKRLYHNLPYLFKSKGTINGLRQLINIFGIPDTVYRIYNYGSLSNEINTFESKDHVFNYALDANRDGYLTVPFKTSGSNDLVPSSVGFRFKLNSKPSGSNVTIGDFRPSDFNSNDLFTGQTVFQQSETLFKLKTTSQDFITCNLENYDSKPSKVYLSYGYNVSQKVEVELYDQEWFYVYLSREYNQTNNKGIYTIHIVKEDSAKTVQVYTSSLQITNEPTVILDKTLSLVVGQGLDYNIQSLEVRNDVLEDKYLISRFYNPKSVESSNVTGFIDNILYYLPLGTDLMTYNHSSVTSLPSLSYNKPYSSWYVTFTGFPNKNNYVTNYDEIYYNNFGTATTKRVTDTIKIKSKDYYGTLLSGFTSIDQSEPDFIDYKFLDVVFSPTFEQDDDIISNLGHISIDDYIGDPSSMYNTKYSTLDLIKKSYLKRVIGNYNVKDYIKLIQYIDNSLFKMIYDFVPVSHTTNTGILIRQNVLHRNIIKHQRPEFVIDSTQTEILNKFNIQSELRLDDLKAVYEFSEGFIPNNKNKFLKSKLSKNELSEFKYSVYNLTNDVVDSKYYSNQTGIINSKYKGNKLSSKQLNKYTQGDISLNKTPTIESYVDKIGFFTDVYENKIFDKKSNIQLKYLVDSNGNLTDLNKSNKNFYSIQGYFVKGDSAVVSLFDVNKYSNQKSLDGSKEIFVSGYSFEPVFYFTNSEKYFKFDSLSEEDSTYLRSIEPFDRDISEKKFIYDLFSQVDVDTTGGFVVGSELDNRYSSYTIPNRNQYQFNVDINLLLKPIVSSFSFKYKLSTYKNYISDESIIDSVIYTHNPIEPFFDQDGNEIPLDIYNTIQRNLEIPINGTESMTFFNNYWSNSKNSLGITRPPYNPDRTWVWDNISRINSDQRTYRIYISNDTIPYTTGKLFEVKNLTTQAVEKLYDEYLEEDQETVNINIPVFELSTILGNIPVGNRGVLTKDYTAIKNSNTLSKYDKVLFVLEQLETNNVTSGSITLMKSSSVYTTANVSNLKIADKDNIVQGLNTKSIVLTRQLINYIDNSIFNSTNSKIYSKYGDINEPFNIESGDIIYIKDSKTKNSFYLEVGNVIITNSNINITLSNTIPSYLTKENIEECVILKRIKDETNVIVNFKKKTGASGYGFLIPSNINPNVLSNIDTITKEVKLKLLNDYTLNKSN